MRAITDTTAAVIARVDYYPFGEELGLTGSPGRFTYNGNEFDDEYGFDLYYYGARYMDPALGRFTTPDPVRDFVNPYSYVRNNPVNAVDPTGMAGWGVEYGSITGYDYGKTNSFWWLSHDAYRRWLKSEYSYASFADDYKREQEEKARDQSSEIKEGKEQAAPQPGDPDFIGPVSPEEDIEYSTKQLILAYMASDNLAFAYYSARIGSDLQSISGVDYLYISFGIGPVYYGLEFGLVVDRWQRAYLGLYSNLGISTPIQGEIALGFFDKDKGPNSREEAYDYFTGDFGGFGISAGAGPSFDVSVSWDGNATYNFGIGGANLNVAIPLWLISVWGTR